MGISIRNSNSQVIIDIHSSMLDERLVRVLRSILIDLIKRDQVNIVINMSIVSYIDSCALGCLMAAQKKCTKRGGTIGIYGVQPDILMIFYVIKLDEYIKLYNNEDDAINHRNMLIRRRFKLVKR